MWRISGVALVSPGFPHDLLSQLVVMVMVMVMTMIIMIMIMIMMMTLIGGGVGDHTNELILLAYHMINFSTLWLVGVTIKMRLWSEDII